MSSGNSCVATTTREAFVRRAGSAFVKVYAVVKIGEGNRFLGYAPRQFFSRQRAERYAERLNQDAPDGVHYIVEET